MFFFISFFLKKNNATLIINMETDQNYPSTLFSKLFLSLPSINLINIWKTPNQL